MENYEIKDRLTGEGEVSAFSAWSKRLRKDVIVKVYRKDYITEAEPLLKEAIRQAQTKSEQSVRLIEVILSPIQGRNQELDVNYVLEKIESRVPMTILARDDNPIYGSRGLSEYEEKTIMKGVVTNDRTRIYTARSVRLQQEVVIKSMRCFDVTDANRYIREALVQTYVEHSRICRLLDICLTKKAPFRMDFKIHLVIEKMQRDMNKDAERRSRSSNKYTEEELLCIMKDVTSGLKHANNLVTIIQNIAHRDVKPHNVFLAVDGSYKLGDFGSTWKKELRAITSSSAGTEGYLSPEMRSCMTDPENCGVDPFISDIFSLGVTMVHLAMLRNPLNITSTNPNDIKACLKEKIRQLEYGDKFRKLLKKMVSIDPCKRPRLEQIVAQLGTITPSMIEHISFPKIKCHEEFSSGTLRRIRNEISCIERDGPPPLCFLKPFGDGNWAHWLGTVQGIEGTPFEGGFFSFFIEYTTDYPFTPPHISCITKIYHPNINARGDTSLNTIFTTEWAPPIVMKHILLYLCVLVNEPDIECAIVPEIAFQYTNDFEMFNKIAREWTKKYTANPRDVIFDRPLTSVFHSN